MNKPIGVFDSGIGGLSVLQELVKLLPEENYLYVADQLHVPYGQRSREEIRYFSKVITQFLLDQGAKIIVVACNTATGAALNWLRDKFPETQFVGMEPAVKPAASKSRTGIIGVLATEGTIKSDRYISLKTRFGMGIEVLEDSCKGLVPLIEGGENDEAIKALLNTVLEPMISKGVDNLVLGCTHYPFIEKHLIELLPDDVDVINPAPAVARQTRNVLANHHQLGKGALSVRFFSTGNQAHLQNQVKILIPDTLEQIQQATFENFPADLFTDVPTDYL
ncbi:MAG: glutamate racemase [Saprospiraceae bacterium]|nr:glutamate racemase [Saprospiraceae bacterium]